METEIAERFGSSTRSNVTSRSPPRSNLLWSLVIGALVLSFIAMITFSVSLHRINTVQPFPELCSDKNCLWEASQIASVMNTSANPCENFYEFACGNFKNVYPIASTWGFTSHMKELTKRNDDRVLAILEASVAANAPEDDYEAKLQFFYQTCQDDFRITKRGAIPLIDAIAKEFFGWYALYNSPANKTSENLNLVLQKLHAQYGVQPFFELDVAPDRLSATGASEAERNLIQLDIPKQRLLTMSYYYYNWNFTSYLAKQTALKTYIRTVVKLIQTESRYRIPNADAVAAAAVSDVFYVESELAKILSMSTVSKKEVDHVESIADIQTNYDGPIKWLDLFVKYFAGADPRPLTQVHVHEQDRLTAIVKLISTLTDRQLNNYLMWRLASSYVEDLGWKYRLALRQFKQDTLFFYAETPNRCLGKAKTEMHVALDALFVESHFGIGSNEKVREINDLVKAELINRVQNIVWMDQATKDKARSKLQATKDYFGYDDWLGDRSQVNVFYSTVKVNKDQHFENVVSLRQFAVKSKVQTLLAPVSEREKWRKGVYTIPYEFYERRLNRAYFPSGLLQHPVFDLNVPQYMNFGFLGNLVASELVTAIDTTGQTYDENGKPGTSWWSEATRDNFNKVYNVTDCFKNLFDEADRKEMIYDMYLNLAARRLWRDIAGLEASITAYEKHVSKYGKEPSLPGLQTETQAQQFFISYAQGYCFDGQTRQQYWQLLDDRRPIGPVVLHKILQQSPHFSRAFNCHGSHILGLSNQICQGF